MINFEDYKKDDGLIDWTSYRKAKIDAGETCYQCNQSVSMFIFYKPSGKRSLCSDCKDLLLQKSVSHDKLIRCPYGV